MWGIFEVFIATLSVCSITALVILTSGVYQENAALLAIQSGTVTSAMVGAPLSAAAFSTVFGRFGVVFVAVCLLLFAFTSLLGSSYYGERGLQYLTGTDRWRWPYRAAFLLAVVAGSVGDVAVVWQLADIFNGRILIVNSGFRIVKDTFSLAEGKICISDETLRCFQGETTSRYDTEKHYFILAVPIADTVQMADARKSTKTAGVMLVTVSTESMFNMEEALLDKASLYQLTVFILCLILSLIHI